MKQLLIYFVIAFGSCAAAKANRIDSLKTDEAVTRFVEELLNQGVGQKAYQVSLQRPDFEPFCCRLDTAMQAKQKGVWQIADFDQDGKNDLFVGAFVTLLHSSDAYDYQCYVIMERAVNNYTITFDPGSIPFSCFLVEPIVINNQPLLRYTKAAAVSRGKQTPSPYFDWVTTIDTLIYRHGAFIELTAPDSIPPIGTINYETTGCFGDCPIFKLQISKDGQATLFARRLNEREGVFNTTIRKKDLAQIVDLIQGINIKQLDSTYYVNYSDAPASHLTVQFVDKTENKIHDFGQHGTMGLMRLYVLLEELTRNQDWK